MTERRCKKKEYEETESKLPKQDVSLFLEEEKERRKEGKESRYVKKTTSYNIGKKYMRGRKKKRKGQTVEGIELYFPE